MVRFLTSPVSPEGYEQPPKGNGRTLNIRVCRGNTSDRPTAIATHYHRRTNTNYRLDCSALGCSASVVRSTDCDTFVVGYAWGLTGPQVTADNGRQKTTEGFFASVPKN